MRVTVFLVGAAMAAAQTKLPPAANVKVDFEKHIQPLMTEKCYNCHGDESQQAGLRLNRRQTAMRGGDYGPVILPGNSADSKLIKRLVGGDGGLQMPPTGALSEEEIGLFRAWIDQGADYRISVEEERPAPPVDPKLAAFVTAVRGVDAKAVEKMIAADPSLVKAKDRSGATPLHHAAGFGTIETMKLLLDKGADPNAANIRKSTPMFWGIHDEAKVRLLLERGADIDAKLNDGRTVAYQAASLGSGLPVLRLLLEKGAKPDVKMLTGATALMSVSGRARLDAMALLIEKGADVNAKSAAGLTPLMAAATSGNVQAVKMLLAKGADANVVGKRGQTALADAALSGNEESVKMLLDAGAKVDVPDERGYTALLAAAGSDAAPAGVVKLLLAKGAKTDAKGDGETAAMLAAKRGDTEVARLLGVSAEDRKKLGVVPAPEGSGRARSVAEAIKPALLLLEKQSHNFIRIGGCNSCHAQDLASAAVGVALERGLPSPKLIPQLPAHMQNNNPERLMDLTAIALSGINWELFDFGMNRVRPDHYTDAAVRYIKAMQLADGSWFSTEGRRPPMNAGAPQQTALAVFAMKHYGPPAEKGDTDKAIARAAAWLERQQPVTTQDRAFHLLGLAWSNANPAAIKTAAKALAAAQRADGGWSQLATMGSDAYATGEALYALNVAGKMAPNDAVYQKGMKYLLRTQAPDGSWHVKTRSIWLQPYFESGFPYAHDQWISAAGTAWATMALAVTVEPTRISQNLSAK